ncbi:hypothetical protein GCM10011589_35910 [Modestobacter marinus]|uniref:RNA polymerase sigma-70 region 4 domain-containing protein n=1 Tax=Modestobacter marinus TaxID=477641 RepID=A0ABQ2G6M0_9ACTN|nr:hypothetical protein GCM10011589_35910 [Modestobacter marinus]
MVPEPDQQGRHARPAPPAHTDVAALYARHHPRLLRQAQRVLPGDQQHAAGDALMTVFGRLLQQQQDGSLTEQPNWEAYLLRAVTNACLDILKSSARTQPVEDPVDVAGQERAPADPTGDTAAQRLDDATRRRRLDAALRTLPDRQREIVLQKAALERTNRDIGRELGLSGQRVGQLYDQAMRQLREEVNRHGD